MVTKKRKIIVLGASSFVGKVVVRFLKKGKYSFEEISGEKDTDLRNCEKANKVMRKYSPTDIISCLAHTGGVHYVMKYSADVITDNMRIITNLYDSVRKYAPQAKIINYLSNCSYPGDADIHSEPDWEKGSVHETVLAYGSSRRMIYIFSKCFYQQYGIKSVNWLVANHYGPGDHLEPDQVHAIDGIIIRMIKAQKNREKAFEIWGTGKPLREWVYIDDLARILVQSLDIDEQIYPVNLAQQKGYSIRDITKVIAKALNYNVKLIYNTKYPDGAPIKILDDSIFRSQYPNFRFTSLEEGIRQTVSYYQKAILK